MICYDKNIKDIKILKYGCIGYLIIFILFIYNKSSIRKNSFSHKLWSVSIFYITKNILYIDKFVIIIDKEYNIYNGTITRTKKKKSI